MATADSTTSIHDEIYSEKNVLKLTANMYAELDYIARTQAGKAVTVSTFEKMDNAWGRFNFMSGDGYVDARKTYGHGSMCDLGCIQIACEVNVEDFRSATRPELDWAAISDDKIYQFILWHEIGHALNNFSEIDLFTLGVPKKVFVKTESGEYEFQEQPSLIEPEKLKELAAKAREPKVVHKLRMANEVLADRFAWKQLFPDRPMQKIKQSKKYFAQIEDDIAEINQLVPLHHYSPKPLPLEPWSRMPVNFVESDEYFYLLGDISDSKSRAGLLVNAWKDYAYYTGNTDNHGTFARVSAFVPSFEDALISRNIIVNRYPRCQIYEIPVGVSKNDYSNHRRVHTPTNKLKISEREEFENSHLPIEIIGFSGNRVSLYAENFNDEMAISFGYEPRNVLNNPKLLDRLSESDIEELVSLANIQLSSIIGLREDNPALFVFDKNYWAVVDRQDNTIISGPFFSAEEAKSETKLQKHNGIKYAAIAYF